MTRYYTSKQLEKDVERFNARTEFYRLLLEVTA